jgi:hypothetical protein
LGLRVVFTAAACGLPNHGSDGLVERLDTLQECPMFPATTRRVELSTNEQTNRKIREQMEERLACYRNASTEQIEQRLQELDREWDIERTLEVNAATVCMLSVFLGTTVNRRWFVLPGVVGAFLLQHALQGWCPPLPVFRRLGVRTSSEIEEERRALLDLRHEMEMEKMLQFRS